MKLFEAPEKYQPDAEDVTVFLAGGISNCWEWQTEVIFNLVSYKNTEHLCVFNPRRRDFPMDDPNAAEDQIAWEYKYLMQADIFSMYFVNSESPQPICFYELGVHATRYAQTQFPKLCISVEEGFSRAQDVEIQTALLLNQRIPQWKYLHLNATAESHAHHIYQLYEKELERKLYVKISKVASVK